MRRPCFAGKIFGSFMICINVFLMSAETGCDICFDRLYPVSQYEILLSRIMVIWADIKNVSGAEKIENFSKKFICKLAQLYCDIKILELSQDFSAEDLNYVYRLMDRLVANKYCFLF